MTGIELIAAERMRQIEEEGFTAEHDDEWEKDELAKAATWYALPEHRRCCIGEVCSIWPWDKEWWKPTPENRINELKKAGALIAAELDRLLRKKNKGEEKMETEKEREQKTKEFRELCKPLNDWLQRNYHPHAKIIIETDHAEIVEGIMAVPFEVID